MMTLAWPQSVFAGVVGALLAYAVEQPPAPSPTPAMSAEEAVQHAREEWRQFRETYEASLNAAGDRAIDNLTTALRIVQQNAKDATVKQTPKAAATRAATPQAMPTPEPTVEPTETPSAGGFLKMFRRR